MKKYSKELETTSIVHLHTCEGSTDGAAKISDYMDCFKNKDIEYATVSDHGSLDAILQFYKSCKKSGIIPGIGVEFYLNDKRDEDKKGKEANEDNTNPEDAKNNHLMAVAKNENGIKNIIQINNEAIQNGFYRKPRSCTDVLFEMGDDLLISSACIAGVPSRLILRKEYDKAKEWLSRYKERFEDDFYIELQFNRVPEQKIANKYLIEFAKELDIKLIVGQDCHYTDDGNNIIRIIKMLDKRKENFKNIEKEGGLPDYLKWMSEETLFVKTNEDFIEKSAEWGFDIPQKTLIEALINNHEWKHKTDLHWNLNVKHYNKFTNFPDEFETADDYFDHLVMSRFKEYVKKGYIPAGEVNEYADRLASETEMLKDKKYVDYFLETNQSIDDIIEITDDPLSIGVGRGSSAGSLTAFVLGITKIDSIKHKLIFERFLSEARSIEILSVDI